MRINVHAGHNPDGKKACGAVGLIKESTENRNVKNEVISQLKTLGHTVYDCTVDDGTSASNVLTKIVEKCNKNEVDLDVSIHFNAGASDGSGNGKTTGTEVLIYNSTSKSKSYAEKVVKAISELGYKNRGVKVRSDLYVLRKTSAPAMLIECCFVDDKDDVALYNYKTMASAIVKGITGQTVQSTPVNSSTSVNETPFTVRVKITNLNIRTGAGTTYAKTGTFCPVGSYTITEVKEGKGSSKGWGKLKSGAGWISLDFVERV